MHELATAEAFVSMSWQRCGHRYDVRRAARGLDEPRLFLEPLPLLVGESGLVKGALGTAGP